MINSRKNYFLLKMIPNKLSLFSVRISVNSSKSNLKGRWKFRPEVKS